jgi:solute carrier family 25 phosphate transporter 23/24/25/41
MALERIVSRTATAPFDRLKVYLITSPSAPLPPPPPPPSASSTSSLKPTKTPRRNAGRLAAAVRAVYSQGGVKAFWTGNMLNVIKIFPVSVSLSYQCLSETRG